MWENGESEENAVNCVQNGDFFAFDGKESGLRLRLCKYIAGTRNEASLGSRSKLDFFFIKKIF